MNPFPRIKTEDKDKTEMPEDDGFNIYKQMKLENLRLRAKLKATKKGLKRKIGEIMDLEKQVDNKRRRIKALNCLLDKKQEKLDRKYSSESSSE